MQPVGVGGGRVGYSMGRLDGKIAVITGGTTGIGAATAELFRNEGATVVVTGANQGNLDRIKAELGVDAIRSDVTTVASIGEGMNTIRERYGRIDILFANAGISGPGQLLEQVDEASFDAVISVNLRGVFFSVQKAVPLMSDGGSIILTSSVGAHGPMPVNMAYGASKAGVRSLGRSLAAALSPRKIRVNVLTPGLFDTPIFGNLPVPAEIVIGRLVKSVPMGRAGDPPEAAQLALFLASDAASFVTGAEYKITGGQSDL